MEDEGRVLRYASKVSHNEVVCLLIDKYLKPKKDDDKDDNDDNDDPDDADDKERKKTFLNKTINKKDGKGLTALHYACQRRSKETLKLLLNNGGGKQYYIIICSTSIRYVIRIKTKF